MVATRGRWYGMNLGCSHVLTWTAVAQAGAVGIATVQGAYSARSGNQVISALMPCSFKFFTRRRVKTSVPVLVRTVGNQIAGVICMLALFNFAQQERYLCYYRAESRQSSEQSCLCFFYSKVCSEALLHGYSVPCNYYCPPDNRTPHAAPHPRSHQ